MPLCSTARRYTLALLILGFTCIPAVAIDEPLRALRGSKLSVETGLARRPGSDDGLLAPLLGAIGLALWNWSNPALDPNTIAWMRHGFGRRMPELLGIFGGAIGMLLLGWLDDNHELAPGKKFLGQLLVALLVAASGVRVTLFVPNPVFSYAMTAFWILTVINAFNFMDNMNGLCAGLGGIAAWNFAVIASAVGQYLVALIAFLACGSLFGFLPHNFPAAKAFLGDSGSHLTGYLLAVLAVLPHFPTPENPKPLAVLKPLLVLVGDYRLLAGPGYTTDGVSFVGVPAAVTPTPYNRAESTAATQVRVAYGVASTGGHVTWGNWCGTCHPDMHSSGNYVHPVHEGLGSGIKTVYDQYRSSGVMTGTNADAFLSLVPFIQNSADYSVLKTNANPTTVLTGPGNTDQVACMSCHRAHASGFPYILRWQMEGEFITSVLDSDGTTPTWPGTDTTPGKPQFARGRLAAENQAAYYDRYCSTSVMQNLVDGALGNTIAVTYWSTGAIISLFAWLIVGGIAMSGGRGWCLFFCPVGALSGISHRIGRRLNMYGISSPACLQRLHHLPGILPHLGGCGRTGQ